MVAKGDAWYAVTANCRGPNQRMTGSHGLHVTATLKKQFIRGRARAALLGYCNYFDSRRSGCCHMHMCCHMTTFTRSQGKLQLVRSAAGGVRCGARTNISRRSASVVMPSHGWMMSSHAVFDWLSPSFPSTHGEEPTALLCIEHWHTAVYF